MTEIAVAPKLLISVTNSCTTASFGSQPNTTSMLNVTPGCCNSEKSIPTGELSTYECNATLAPSFTSGSPPKRIPHVQQPNHSSDGYTTTCPQNVLTYSPKRTTSPSNQLSQQQQHYHHHYNHYHSPHHNYHQHHHYLYPIRQQAAVRQLQEFMLLQWRNFEYRNHQAKSFGNACTITKSKPYYGTPRYSQSKRDFQSTAEAKYVSLPHSLPQGDRNSPINVSTKGPLGNQMMSGATMGDTWATAVPFYRRKLVSSSGNLSPTQQQSLRHSGSVDAVTWQRGYSTFQKTNYNNNSTRLPPVDTVSVSGPRLTSPARGHSVGSASSSSGSTSGTGCTPSHYRSSAAPVGGDRTVVGASQEQVPRVSARKDRQVEATNRCAPHVPAPQTILSCRPLDQGRYNNDEDKSLQPSARTTESCFPVVVGEHSPTTSVEKPTSGNGDQLTNSSLSVAPMSSPPLVDSQCPTDDLVVNSNAAKPSDDVTQQPESLATGPTSPSEKVLTHSSWQLDLPNPSSGEEGGRLRVGDQTNSTESPDGALCHPANGGVDGYFTASDQTPPASLPVAISVNTVSSSVSSGDGLAGGEHFWTPDPPASPANTVATSNEDVGQTFSLVQARSSTTTATLDGLNDVD